MMRSLNIFVDVIFNLYVMVEQVVVVWYDSKFVQVFYYDWEVENYDEKWLIFYDQCCVDYVCGWFDVIVFDEVIVQLFYDCVLELGCGIGFFLFNLIQVGVVWCGLVIDFLFGMVKVVICNG